MPIALRWREEPFDCEFAGSAAGGMLRIFSDGTIVWEEPAGSAAAAYDRAREVRDLLLSPRAKHA